MGSLREIAPKLVSASQQHKTLSKQTANFLRTTIVSIIRSTIYLSSRRASSSSSSDISYILPSCAEKESSQMQNADVVRVAKQGTTPQISGNGMIIYNVVS
jgi:hypothetical protein